MERITKRIGGAVVFPEKIVGITLTPDNNTMNEILKTLAKYEDMAEVDRLWIPAFAVGDIAWYIDTDTETKDCLIDGIRWERNVYRKSVHSGIVAYIEGHTDDENKFPSMGQKMITRMITRLNLSRLQSAENAAR